MKMIWKEFLKKKEINNEEYLIQIIVIFICGLIWGKYLL